jgi:hypothetical protein
MINDEFYNELIFKGLQNLSLAVPHKLIFLNDLVQDFKLGIQVLEKKKRFINFIFN